ncbi:toll/interleukin-1 receptor domain-containing protein [Tistrella mobilis]|uniref:toll/interleukin-1 receptor domain-containing protein n=1 Tax=Tistrella mobilis TaxID=171437 RepID=UPI003558B7B0
MSLPTRPFLIVYIVWHPDFEDGGATAKALHDHYRRDVFKNVAGGTGLSVIYRFEPTGDGTAPLPIDFEEGETAAVVVLYDAHFGADNAYRTWLEETARGADAHGLGSRVFPIAIDGTFTQLGMVEQAIRWDHWDKMEPKARTGRLISVLSYQFARMLRTYLERLRYPAEPDDELQRYLKRVQVFLSHSKWDNDGAKIALKIREALFKSDDLSSFFDVYNIPPGLPFDRVILSQIRASAVIAIHTDSFSSRTWCRQEVLEAKRAGVPLIVANCIADGDERGFPYMGNVPVVRMDPVRADRIDDVIGRLLDEVLKDFLWRCKVALVADAAEAGVRFLPRLPELISLVGLDRQAVDVATLVYPDPPLGTEEQRLFEEVAPTVRLRSMTEWIAEREATR